MATIQNIFLTIPFLIGLIVLGRFFLFNTAPAFSESWIAQLMLGLIFSIAGGGLLAFKLHRQRASAKIQALKAEYPEQPWLWREDWCQGYANSTTTPTSYLFLFMGVLFVLFSAPFLPQIFRDLLRGNWHVLFVLFFPITGIALLTAFARERIRLRRFGRSRFYFDSPISLGSHLNGKICLPGQQLINHPARLVLNCYRENQGGYRGNNSIDKVIWETSTNSTSQHNHNGVCFPVDIPIPYDLPATGKESPGAIIFWYLKISSNVPGVNFNSGYYIPVHRTDKSDPSLTRAELRHEEGDQQQLLPAGFRSFSCRQVNAGLIVETRRGLAAMAGLVFFVAGLVFAGFAAVFAHHSTLFGVIFGALSVFMILASLPEFFRKTTLIFGPEVLSATISGLLPSKRKYPYTEIQSVDVVSNASAFSKRWYDLQLRVNADGIANKKTVPCRLQKAEIDWLAAQLENQLSSAKAHPSR